MGADVVFESRIVGAGDGAVLVQYALRGHGIAGGGLQHLRLQELALGIRRRRSHDLRVVAVFELRIPHPEFDEVARIVRLGGDGIRVLVVGRGLEIVDVTVE